MNLSSALSIPVPAIAYTILHRKRSGVPLDDYAGTLRTIHERIAQESAALAAEYRKARAETVARESQVLRGHLSQFLATPIRSDNAEVQRILSEGFERSLGPAELEGSPGIGSSYEGIVVTATLKSAAGKRLVQDGKNLLLELGMESRKGEEVFESVYLLRGGASLDILEHVVRDRPGMYAVTHDKIVVESSVAVSAVYNLLQAKGEIPPREKRAGMMEVALHLSKPEMPYGPFKQEMAAAADRAMAAGRALHGALWQRKLGLGRGREFVLRFLCDSPAGCEAIVQTLLEIKEPVFVKESLAERTAIVMKQLLF